MIPINSITKVTLVMTLSEVGLKQFKIKRARLMKEGWKPLLEPIVHVGCSGEKTEYSETLQKIEEM